MLQRDLSGKIVTTIVIVALQGLMIPVSAVEEPATLRGAVVSIVDEAPLVGVRLHVGDPKSGRVFTSEPTGTDGGFRLEHLPPATYEVAVQTGDALFIAGSAIRLAPGQVRGIDVALNPQMADDPQTAGKPQPAKGSLWSNPATAALIVLGAAVVLGVVIDEATDDSGELLASP